MPDSLLNPAGNLLNYTHQEMVVNMLLATLLGFIIASVYRYTHKGLSYSQSFTHTILFVAVVVSLVMMVIGGSLARAFALVGALSIIRFRTVVKDTKDISFIFAALALGMAAGTSNYFLGVAGTIIICLLAIGVHRFNYAALYKSEFILRFCFDQNYNSAEYLDRIQEFSRRSNMLHIEPSGDGNLLKLTYDIILKEEATAADLTKSISGIDGVSEVVLIASKSDVDY